MNEHNRRHRASPHGKANRKEYDAKRLATPHHKAMNKAYNQTNKSMLVARQKEYYQHNKARIAANQKLVHAEVPRLPAGQGQNGRAQSEVRGYPAW